MSKYDESLFKIGEVTKILGVTRKALLVYEDMGLMTPAVKDAESGYRYYSADNMMQVRAIRSLQEMGLSLKEIAEYYNDKENIDGLLQRLMAMRKNLDQHIQQLQRRAAKRGDMTVHKTKLPSQVCFCRTYECEDVADAARKLRETYIAAAHTGKLCKYNITFTQRMSLFYEKMKVMCCIPVGSSFEGPERREFDETPALCIYYRGPYESMADAMKALLEYVKENNIENTGPLRCIYLEGPSSRGANSGDYITQVAMPIKE